MEQEKQRILEICNVIRGRVQTHIPEIDLNFPIIELGTGNFRIDRTRFCGKSLLGFCHTKITEWEQVGPYWVPKVSYMEGIEITLEINGELISITSIVATFLHELAHSITPFRRLGVEFKTSKPEDAHNPAFYKSFARILQVAEELDIFTLQNKPNKFTMQSLKRFDDLDVAVCPKSMIGSSKYDMAEASEDQPLRLTLVNASNIKKMVILNKRTEAELLKIAKQKYRTKFTKILNPDGSACTNLVTVENDSTILLH